MREIKFRVWDTEIKRMAHWDMLLDCWIHWLRGEDPKAIVMQYTGLKDKYGKEIWEGDVVMFLTEPPGAGGKTKKCCGEVWYRPEECGYSVKSPQFMYSSGRPMIIGLCPRPEYYEVVGNIYKNPDLLEAKKCGGEKQGQ